MIRFVYILQLVNWQYYVGSTNDITRRLLDHKTWHTTTTKRIPVQQILFQRGYTTKQKARKIEMFLKKQKSRMVIEKFMTNEWKDL